MCGAGLGQQFWGDYWQAPLGQCHTWVSATLRSVLPMLGSAQCHPHFTRACNCPSIGASFFATVSAGVRVSLLPPQCVFWGQLWHGDSVTQSRVILFTL
ncbi:hypothetical protein E2C01_028836 [Portunus trituberculatus]|uniref:Uncharacterized protein n=1 Tax=Portunus trituberculatus TaxID=210409 RepID=A0A5B7ESX8_PORTR|nr:hypothetical protein [Portunus trituberculatus]